jgi:hypothetical protein
MEERLLQLLSRYNTQTLSREGDFTSISVDEKKESIAPILGVPSSETAGPPETLSIPIRLAPDRGLREPVLVTRPDGR